MVRRKRKQSIELTPRPEDLEDVTALIYPDCLPALERDDITEMGVPERRRRLSRFARENVYTPGGAPHRMPAIQSIVELNKMDGSYAPQRYQHQHIVFEVVLVDRTRQEETTTEEDAPQGELT